jgi:hypothetical protein
VVPHYVGSSDRRGHRLADESARDPCWAATTDSGDLRLVARTSALNTAIRRELGHRLAPSGSDTLGTGGISAPDGEPGGELEFRTVRPELVAEFVSDTDVDVSRYRHPVRSVRLCDDLTPHQTLPFTA